MILGFSTKFPKGKGELSGKQTFFVEKIWACFMTELLIDFYKEKYDISFTNHQEISDLIKENSGYEIDWDKYNEYNHDNVLGKKKHTIREDKNNRWGINDDIHFFINARTKKMFQFAPIGKIVDVEGFQVTYDKAFCEAMGQTPVVMVNDRILEIDEVEELSQNDGFKDSQEFVTWFNKDFKGRILHWTYTEYE